MFTGFANSSQNATLNAPPPPGTVPIRIPVASQGGYLPARPYNPEPYNPEAPSISAPPARGYFPRPRMPAGVPRPGSFPVVQSYPTAIPSAHAAQTAQQNLVNVPTRGEQQQRPPQSLEITSQFMHFEW